MPQATMKHVPTMRERDKALITSVVRRVGPISRKKIHHLTRFRPATISALVRELLDEGVLAKAGLSNNPLGRKQILLRVSERFGFIVALDFDAEFVSAAPMSAMAVLLTEGHREATQLSGGKEGLIDQLVRCTRRIIETADPEWGRLLGIGIGDPGLVNTRDGISVFSSTIEFWRGVALREIFQKEFGVPVVIANNTRTKAAAERALGSGKNASDIIYIEYGTGIGAGIFTRGILVEGHHWGGGEFGHTATTEGGPPCKCGSFGCLEAIAGLGAIETRMRTALRDGGYSKCLTMAGGDVEKITGWTVLEASAGGDKMSIAIVDELGRHLGFGIANLVNLFDPELVILDQRLALAGPGLLEQITRVVRTRALAHSTESLIFHFGALGAQAGLLGAGLSMADALFEVPILKPPKFMLDPDELAGDFSSAWSPPVEKKLLMTKMN